MVDDYFGIQDMIRVVSYNRANIIYSLLYLITLSKS